MSNVTQNEFPNKTIEVQNVEETENFSNFIRPYNSLLMVWHHANINVFSKGTLCRFLVVIIGQLTKLKRIMFWPLTRWKRNSLSGWSSASVVHFIMLINASRLFNIILDPLWESLVYNNSVSSGHLTIIYQKRLEKVRKHSIVSRETRLVSKGFD